MALLPPNEFISAGAGASAETLAVTSVSQAPRAAASSHLSDSGVPFASMPDEAAALTRSHAPGAAAEIPDIRVDQDENLQLLLPAFTRRSVSSNQDEEGHNISEVSLQDLREGNASREELSRRSPQAHVERPGSRASSTCNPTRETGEAGSVSGLRDNAAQASSGCSPRGLHKTISDQVALPELPRGGTSDLEAFCGVDLIPEIFAGAKRLDELDEQFLFELDPGNQKYRGMRKPRLDVISFMTDIEEVPLFIQQQRRA